jgi:hypothetical protein
VTERDRKGLDRLVQFFSLPSIAELLSGLGSGGLIWRVHAAAASEFVVSNRDSVIGLTAERDYWRQQAQSQVADVSAARALVGQLQERCKHLESAHQDLEAARREDRLEAVYQLRRAEGDLVEKVNLVARLLDELASKRASCAVQKLAAERLRRKDEERKKNERNKAWVREEISQLGRKLGERSITEINRAVQQRRRAAVLDTRRRGTSYRNTKVREVLEDTLEKIKGIVSTGEDPEKDEKRALETIGRAFSVKSGKKSLTAHPELMVPGRVKEQLQEEGRKAVVAWMRTPGRWAKVMDLADISFSRASKLSEAFPPGAKLANKDIILEKKKLNHVMQIINLIKETPGGNGHQFQLPTLLSLLVPL